MSNDDAIDQSKRRFLTGATTALGGAALVGAAAPFVGYWQPSEDTKIAGGPIDVDISTLKPGEQLTVPWRGKPIWIIKRTPENLAALQAIDQQALRDPTSVIDQQPTYAHNAYRSRTKELLVLVGVCTHLGCAPTYRPNQGSIDTNWPGGFFCSCHGSKFDLAGRVFKGVPAPINLEVPPYAFVNETTIRIGVDNIKGNPAL